jgi:hypothetical protein
MATAGRAREGSVERVKVDKISRLASESTSSESVWGMWIDVSQPAACGGQESKACGLQVENAASSDFTTSSRHRAAQQLFGICLLDT